MFLQPRLKEGTLKADGHLIEGQHIHCTALSDVTDAGSSICCSEFLTTAYRTWLCIEDKDYI
jgi:hypothetical protein